MLASEVILDPASSSVRTRTPTGAAGGAKDGVVEGSELRRLAKSVLSIPRAHESKVLASVRAKVNLSLLNAFQTVFKTSRGRYVYSYADRDTFYNPERCYE